MHVLCGMEAKEYWESETSMTENTETKNAGLHLGNIDK